MNIKYTLENKIKFEELCEIVCMTKRQGYKVDEYFICNTDGNYMDVYFSNEDKSFSINDSGRIVNLSGFTPEEALEQYKCIVDNVENGEGENK